MMGGEGNEDPEASSVLGVWSPVTFSSTLESALLWRHGHSKVCKSQGIPNQRCPEELVGRNEKDCPSSAALYLWGPGRRLGLPHSSSFFPFSMPELSPWVGPLVNQKGVLWEEDKGQSSLPGALRDVELFLQEASVPVPARVCLVEGCHLLTSLARPEVFELGA